VPFSASSRNQRHCAEADGSVRRKSNSAGPVTSLACLTPKLRKRAINGWKLVWLLMGSEVIQSYPGIAEMDLNPVIVHDTGTSVDDARIKLKE
jgi:hypothetical protein